MKKFLFCCVLLFAACLTLEGCRHVPPEDGPVSDDDTPSPPDADAIVAAVAGGLSTTGTILRDTAATWGECIAGVTLIAVGDYTEEVAIPIRQAIEAGNCSGSIGSVTIDPSPCAGLPGEPAVSGQETARTDVEHYLALALPAAAAFASAGSSASEDPYLCVVLKLLGDLLVPGGQLATSVLAIVEEPGAPFTSPAMTWECGDCYPLRE